MVAPRHAARVLSLYRRLLQLHRRLPRPLAELGDGYVRDEFRRNKAAEPRLAERFLAEWEAYARTLQAQVIRDAGAAIRPGAYMEEEHLASLREEQIEQLYELMRATTAAPGGPESPGGSGAAGAGADAPGAAGHGVNGSGAAGSGVGGSGVPAAPGGTAS